MVPWEFYSYAPNANTSKTPPSYPMCGFQKGAKRVQITEGR
ncbi:hypothetical protein CCACVL1_23542 [Corchorus capsularis]|uniref:Uncharacterized protein n=1 Tax=Corchorus capsularis TaxID=210143 RepID=A0A1R3GTP9_COCAP|nr:hypothetical protein CCACVL1_23542 [Corchorus capsularis]